MSRLLKSFEPSIIISMVVVAGLIFSGCGRKDAPESAIIKVKDRVNFVVDSIADEREVVKSELQLIDEYEYDVGNKRYVVEYRAVTELDTNHTIDEKEFSVYLIQSPEGWKYSFLFDKDYEGYVKNIPKYKEEEPIAE